MKLYEITKSNGTYVGLKITKDCRSKLQELVENLGLENPIKSSLFHTTLINSKKELTEFEARGKLSEPIVAKVKGLKVFDSKEGNKVLVLSISSSEIMKRNSEITSEHKATSDYDEFVPHITLSYNEPNAEGLKDQKIDEFIEEIVFDNEYSQEKQSGWYSKNK